MNDLSGRVMRWAWPTIGGLFICLYAMSLFSGAEVESALLRAGLAGLLLAVLCRLAVWVIETAEHSLPSDHHVEATTLETSQDTSIPTSAEIGTTAGGR